MKKRVILIPIIAAAFAASGCSAYEPYEAENISAVSSLTQTAKTVNTSDMFTENDMKAEYDESKGVKIYLSGDTAFCDSDSVRISGSTVTVTDEGTYILSGTLSDGMIIVSAEDTDKIRLVLDGVRISNSDSAAIYVSRADKVFVTTACGSENTLSNGGKYSAIDDNNIDAVIFSKDDLTFNGSGTLTVNASAGHGIVSKDDLVLTGGTYCVTAAEQGLSGKDSIRIADGTYTIISGSDGIHSDNADDTEKGFVYIKDGSFSFTSKGDAVSAEEYLTVDGGDFFVATGNGSASVTMPAEQFGFGMRGEFNSESAAAESKVSCKGFKTDGVLNINGGSFTIDTEDDSFHAGGSILVSGGIFNIRSGDDALHSDSDVIISGGDFVIEYCYEGIEGLGITIDNGTFDITACDDGINSAGGADSSGFGGRRDEFAAQADCLITVNGGTFVIVSDGDCLDSNGDLIINGGTLKLTCNGNGNTALDCNGKYTNNGGDVTTNDGSENNPGQMPGVPGDMGGMRDGEGMGGRGDMKPPPQYG